MQSVNVESDQVVFAQYMSFFKHLNLSEENLAILEQYKNFFNSLNSSPVESDHKLNDDDAVSPDLLEQSEVQYNLNSTSDEMEI